MAERNLSNATAAVTPGIGKIFFDILFSNRTGESLDMDFLENDYSPLADFTYNFAGSATMVSMATIWPGFDSNSRVIIMVPPRGNTNSIVLKGVTGDTGISLNPNGILVIPVPSSPASTWGFTVATATTLVRFIVL